MIIHWQWTNGGWGVSLQNDEQEEVVWCLPRCWFRKRHHNIMREIHCDMVYGMNNTINYITIYNHRFLALPDFFLAFSFLVFLGTYLSEILGLGLVPDRHWIAWLIHSIPALTLEWMLGSGRGHTPLGFPNCMVSDALNSPPDATNLPSNVIL